MSTTLLYVLAAVYGLVVGSFVNVVIVRIPSDESLLRPRSKCPMCQTPIELRDNIPVISWVLLRGRCRSCGEPIPAGYPLVEAANGVLWVLAAARFGFTLEGLGYAVLFSVLLALSVIDLELYILPNRITYPSILASLVILPLLAVSIGEEVRTDITGALIGGVAYGGGLALVVILYELIARKQGMGMGDVKLAVLLGLWIGFQSPYLVLYALILASVLGLIVGAGVYLVRKESRPYPFGPWLALGALVVILASEPILDRLVNV